MIFSAVVRLKASCLALSCALILGGSEVAFAQDPSRAESLFNEGVEDMLAGRYESGCARILESNKLEPKPGGVFTLAECYSRAGRIGSAVENYAAYLSLYETLPPEQRAAHDERASIARAERDKLTPEVPQITLVWPGIAPDGARIARDGVTIDPGLVGRSQRVDPGDHVFSVTYPDGKTSERRINVSRGQNLRVVLPERVALEDPESELPVTEPGNGSEQPPVPTSSTRTWAYVAGGIGVAGLLAGSITGALVLSKKKDIDAHCRPISTNTAGCDEEGLSAVRSAETLGTVSTISFGVGLAGLALAVPLFLLEPSAAPAQTRTGSWRLQVSRSGRAAELSVGGRF